MNSGQVELGFADIFDGYLNDLDSFKFVGTMAVSIGLAAGGSQLGQGAAQIFKYFISPVAIVMAGDIIFNGAVLYIAYQKWPTKHRRVVYSVDHTGITARDASGQSVAYTWQSYERLTTRPKGWLLKRRADECTHWFPRRTFDAASSAQFEALAREKLSQKLSK